MSLVHMLMGSGGAAPPTGYAARVLADGPAFYWKLDETSGDFVDASSNGNNGVVTGTIGRLGTGLIGASPRSARFTRANNAYVTPNTNVFGNNYADGFTVAMSVKPKSLSAAHGLASIGLDASDYGMALLMNADGSMQMNVVTTGSGVVAHTSTAAGAYFVVDAVQMIWASFEPLVGIKLWMDGTLIDSHATTTHTILRNSTPRFALGRCVTPFYLDAEIDDVAVYTRALTSGEIAAQYAARAS